MTTHMNTNMNNFFSELQEYEFSKKNIENILKKKENIKENTSVTLNSNIDKNKNNNKNNNNNIFIPKEKDSLFWCFFLIKNGHLNYELMENKNIITEKHTHLLNEMIRS